jgi:hypothetical protein
MKHFACVNIRKILCIHNLLISDFVAHGVLPRWLRLISVAASQTVGRAAAWKTGRAAGSWWFHSDQAV